MLVTQTQSAGATLCETNLWRPQEKWAVGIGGRQWPALLFGVAPLGGTKAWTWHTALNQ